MSSTPPGTEWIESPFYQQFYASRSFTGDEDFFQVVREKLKPAAGSRLLHAGCGNGHLSRQLAHHGYEVTGIDRSEAAIAAAIAGGNANPEFFLHDLRLPLRGSYFDFAFCFFPTLGLYRTRREHDDAIRTIASSLKPGGKLLIDFPNTHFQEEHLVANETIQINGNSFELHRWDDAEFFHTRITVRGKATPIPEVFTETIFKFSLGDFNDMLSFQGLKILDVYGNYELDRYDVRKTSRLIILAARPA